MADFLTKESFQKKTNITKWIFWLGLGALAFFFWGSIVPFVLMTITNTIYTIIAGVILAVLIYTIFIDKQASTWAWYIYNAFFIWLTKITVETRPVEIMKSYVKFMRKKYDEIVEGIEMLAGKMGELKKQIDKNEEKIEENTKLGLAAAKQGKSPVLYTNEAARLQKSNQRLIPVLQRMQRIKDYCMKMEEATDFMIRDTENEMNAQIAEYKAVKASYSVMKATQAILKGDKNKKNIFDDAVKFVDEDMGRRIGEIDHFMTMSKSIFDKMDIEKQVLEDDGLKMIEDLMKKDPAMLMQGNTSYVKGNISDQQKETVKLNRNTDNTGGEYSDIINF